jgi:hypothetical protein
MTTDNGMSGSERRRELPYYKCVRCGGRFESEIQVLTHLKNGHAGEGDGKFDYSANLPPRYLDTDAEQ